MELAGPPFPCKNPQVLLGLGPGATVMALPEPSLGKGEKGPCQGCGGVRHSPAHPGAAAPQDQCSSLREGAGGTGGEVPGLWDRACHHHP